MPPYVSGCTNVDYDTTYINAGTQTLVFNSLTEFKQWKEWEEENTSTTFIRDNHACVHVRSAIEGTAFIPVQLRACKRT